MALVKQFIYKNRNPRGTICPECRRWLDHAFDEGFWRPRLPRHAGCYCFYQQVYVNRPDTPPPDVITVPLVTVPPLAFARQSSPESQSPDLAQKGEELSPRQQRLQRPPEPSPVTPPPLHGPGLILPTSRPNPADVIAP